MKLKQLLEMDLFSLHSNPEKLKGNDEKHLVVPDLVLDALKKGTLSKEETKKAINVIKKNAKTAYWYSNEVLKGRFKEGEKAINL